MFLDTQALPRTLKGNEVKNSPTKTWITYGDVKEIGSAGSFGMRCLFFLTTFYNEIRLPGDGVNRLVKHLVIRGVLEKPKDIFICTPDRTQSHMRSPRLAVLAISFRIAPKTAMTSLRTSNCWCRPRRMWPTRDPRPSHVRAHAAR